MKLPTPQKESIVSELTEVLGNSALTILTDYRGLSVSQLQELRGQLRPHQAEFRVVKNTLTKLAAQNTGLDSLDESLVGPTALVLSYDDPAQPAKVVRDYARSSRILEIKVAILEGEVITADQVIEIADLPGREELLAKVVGGMSSPIYGLVNVLSGPARSLVYALQARADQLEEAA